MKYSKVYCSAVWYQKLMIGSTTCPFFYDGIPLYAFTGTFSTLSPLIFLLCWNSSHIPYLSLSFYPFASLTPSLFSSLPFSFLNRWAVWVCMQDWFTTTTSLSASICSVPTTSSSLRNRDPRSAILPWFLNHYWRFLFLIILGFRIYLFSYMAREVVIIFVICSRIEYFCVCVFSLRQMPSLHTYSLIYLPANLPSY